MCTFRYVPGMAGFTDEPPAGDPQTDEPRKDQGVERLLELLWLFRVPGAVRDDAQVEACGYPDVRREDSAGRRTFTNDRQRLAELGIELVQLPGHRWRVSETSDPTAFQLTPAERAALLEAEILLGGDDGAADTRPVAPIPAAVPVLLAACRGRHPVTFAYDGRARTVHPSLVTVSGTGFWYLQADDPTLGRMRTFRIDRITGEVTVDRERTVRVSAVPVGLHPTGWDVDEPVDAVVVFAHEPLPEWLAMLGPCERDDTGTAGTERTWRWRTTNHAVFVARLLAIGPSARLVGPPQLRARLDEVLAAHLHAMGTAVR